jgi:hypothetical protein
MRTWYISESAYVFEEYAWAPQHIRWSKAKAKLGREGQKHAMTPLNAIVSGPVAGRPFESDDLTPRAVSRD